MPPRSWGATTQRGDTVFVHVLDWPDRELALPDFGRRVVRASMLASGAKVDVAQRTSGITLALPLATPADAIDQVVVLETVRRR